ncbi:hypothetical protein N0V82_008399 [Gnomoniopsis sp. IMI 355080]|nr:hypothetical protein N0V82_008399 [Gnomoniopsis sp. IMI 355080]
MRDILHTLAIGLIGAGGAAAQAPGLPIVDLNVTIHQATLNETAGYFNFSNIPYAEPPLGDLRFQRSIPLQTPNRTLNDGSNPRICPQGTPLWQITVPPPIPFASPPPAPPAGAPPGPPPPDPQESEDCLLLDVMVPVQTFNAALGGTAPLAPVLVWIHGGGFAGGSKANQGNPAQLVAKSAQGGLGGMVFVQINYRLGMFGFPPKGPTDTNVDPNAGFFDQQLALQWVQQNIKAFGGDPAQVTVMGESAGGASIWAQLQAFGSQADTPLMQRAIIQSPAQRPASDAVLYAQVFQEFVATSNLTSVTAARALDTQQLQSLNREIIGNAAFGAFTFGPSIDGDFLPANQFTMLQAGQFARNVDAIVAHNANEGLLFTDPRVQNETDLIAYLSAFMPSINPTVIQNIATNIYPEEFSGALGYTTPTERLALLNSEAIVGCNVNALAKAFATTLRAPNPANAGAANGYLFSVNPAIHAQDLGYTFFNGPSADVFGNSVDPTVADQLQTIIVDFVIQGRKNLAVPVQPGAAPAAPPPVLDAFSLLALNVTGSSLVQDPTNDIRCQVWQSGLTN